MLKTHWVFQFFTDCHTASEFIRRNGPDSCCIMGVKEKVADRLSQVALPFTALEFVRSDHGIWANEQNAASLPLGCLSSTAWVRRLKRITIVRSMEAGQHWIWKGRRMSNSVLVRFDVAAEGDDVGFAVCGQDVQPHSQVDDGGEDLGELMPTSALVDLRAEIVLETTVEDARRVRLLPDVNHISQRQVGQQGRVRITVDLPESVIPGATLQSCIWSRSSLRASTGMLLYQCTEQWEELSSLLLTEAWASRRVICESPRVTIDTSTSLNSDDVFSRLKEWRFAGLISEDISYRSWRVDNEGRVDLSIGVIDSGAKAEIRNVDPRFTTGACKALLSAIGIWIDCRSILISEVFDSEGSTSRTLKMNVSKNDINRLVGFSRSFKWHDEHMRVLFDEAEHFPEHHSRTAPHGGSTLARRHAPCFAARG